MNITGLQSFVQGITGNWMVLAFTAIIILGIVAELLHHSKVTMQWLLYIVIVAAAAGGAAAEAQAWAGH